MHGKWARSRLPGFARYGDQVSQILANSHEHWKIDRPQITKLEFF